MRLSDAQAQLNARFSYRSDHGEYWRILSDSGAIAGDCEDYSLTLVWLAEGRSIWRFLLAIVAFKYVLWQCVSPGGVGHVVLWARGHGWTDNIQQKMVTRQYLRAKGYRLRWPIIAPIVALKFMLRRVTGRRKT